MKNATLPAVTSLIILVGCAAEKPNAEQGCVDFAMATCARSYECLSASELAVANLPTTEAACVDQLVGRLNCTALTAETLCPEGRSYRTDEADTCLMEIGDATCEEIRTGSGSAPACDRVCS